MGKLIYSYLVSLDGYVEDRDGNFDWAVPDEEVHAFINDLQQSVRTSLYGRRMYEMMSAWESPDDFAGDSQAEQDFAGLWQAAEKIVYSTSLQEAPTARTRLERRFEPESIRQLKAAVDHDIDVGGANLGGQALRAGLVDELQLFVAPVVVGGGKRLLPDDVHVPLELLDERRFPGGMVYLRYGVSA